MRPVTGRNEDDGRDEVSSTLVVNGRFLRSRPTGLHRVGRNLVDALRRVGPAFEVWAPAAVDDPRVDRHQPSAPGKVGDLLWEQTALPLRAGGHVVLSLANTGPVLARHGVVLIHDTAMLGDRGWFARSMRGYAAVVVAAARHADLVLTVSESVAAELTAAGLTGRHGRPPVVVRSAVDPSFHPVDVAARAAVRRRHDLDRPYLLIVGWTDPRKDIATVVAAHRRLVTEVDHVLVTVGQGPSHFAPVSVPEGARVRHLGYVDDADLVALLGGATALLCPSRYEGFGLPPLEAMACGTPALVSDIPVLRESTGGRAVFLPVGDVTAWAHAMREALAGLTPEPMPTRWTWDDAGRVLATALAPVMR